MLFLLAFLFPSWAFAAPPKAHSTHQLKEYFDAPLGWHPVGLPPPDHNIALQIALRQPNYHVLEQHLLDVSDPDHARYGEHLTKVEVEQLVAPSEESVILANSWLESFGTRKSDITLSPARDWLRVVLPVSTVEQMLDTTYRVWQHEDGTELVRTTSYSLPDHLHPHIDLVQPTTLFGRWKPLKITSFVDSDDSRKSVNAASELLLDHGLVDSACDTSITVNCLLQLYNATGFTPSSPASSFGITGYLEQYANLDDMQKFYKEQVPKAVGSSFDLVSVKGGLNSQDTALAGVEANLDVQFGFGITHPIPATFYSTAGRPPIISKAGSGSKENSNEPYNDWLDFVLGQEHPPRVISTSYGEPEATVPLSYARRVCQGFAQLGARGVTLTFSSGDEGVGGEDQACSRFEPLFPAGCPFVTAIGGTYNVPEIAVSFSGGGFSDYFSRPSYQDEVVPRYLKSLPEGTYTGLFNPEGRGIPDIAAEALRFRVWHQGQPKSVGGTSAAAPTAAGIIALLNDVRLQKGMAPFGFINPLLYKQGIDAAFNDITEGSNPGCGTGGFNATVGWDPISGFGTPNFGVLRDLVC